MESLYGSFTQTDYENLMSEYHSLMYEQIEKGVDHSERLAKLHKILWEDEDMCFEDLAKFNKRETMIILAQSKETDGHALYSNSFFVGMTKQEYYLYVKPIFDKFTDRHHSRANNVRASKANGRPINPTYLGRKISREEIVHRQFDSGNGTRYYQSNNKRTTECIRG